METITSNLNRFNDYSHAPSSVKLTFTPEQIERINEVRKIVKDNNLEFAKIPHVSDSMYFSDKDEQDESFLNDINNPNIAEYWKDSCEGLLIFAGSVYYTASLDYDQSDVIESDDLSEQLFNN